MSAVSLREKAFFEAAKILEQKEPYLNQRPIRTKTLQAGETCLDFLTRKIRSKNCSYWQEALERGELTRNSKTLRAEHILRSGDLIIHTLTESPEPPINPHIEILHEDENLLVINKPAPLPVHPCGRYRFHTFTEIAKLAWPDLNLKLVHRLDAETTGVLILAKTAQVARMLTEQFSQRLVQKYYLAQVSPPPSWQELVYDLPITSNKYPEGQSAITLFVCLTKNQHEALILAKPITGRTNQIRVHLKALGSPVSHLHAYKIGIPDREQPVQTQATPAPGKF